MKQVALFGLILLPVAAGAQLGTWNLINLQQQLNKKWTAFGEVQLRSLRLYNEFHYYEYKGGMSYNFNRQVAAQVGLGNYDTYRPGGNFKTPMLNDEFRTWVQLRIKHELGRFQMEHRYRAEQRWTQDGYRNRFRYRTQVLLPFRNKTGKENGWYTVAWNEIFFTNLPPYFERNRVFAGAGHEFSNHLTVQAGYLYQFDYRLTDEIGRDFLQLSLQYQLPWRKSKTAGVQPVDQ